MKCSGQSKKARERLTESETTVSVWRQNSDVKNTNVSPQILTVTEDKVYEKTGVRKHEDREHLIYQLTAITVCE